MKDTLREQFWEQIENNNEMSFDDIGVDKMANFWLNKRDSELKEIIEELEKMQDRYDIGTFGTGYNVAISQIIIKLKERL